MQTTKNLSPPQINGTATIPRVSYSGGFPLLFSVIFKHWVFSLFLRALKYSGNADSIKIKYPSTPIHNPAAILATIRSVKSKESPLPFKFLNILEIIASDISEVTASSFCVQFFSARYLFTALTKTVVLPSLVVGLCFGICLAKAVP